MACALEFKNDGCLAIAEMAFKKGDAVENDIESTASETNSKDMDELLSSDKQGSDISEDTASRISNKDMEGLHSTDKLESDISQVDSGIDENSVDSSIITSSMLEEERKLQMKLKREEERKRRAFEKAQHDQEMKELRYKRLMHLLEKSQFFSSFMEEKISKFLSSEKSKKPTKNTKTNTGKRKRAEAIEDFSEEIASACKKLRNDRAEEKTKKNEKTIDSGKFCLNSGSSNSNKENKEAVKEETRISGLGIEVPARQPMLLEGAALRDYQLDGLNWLKLLYETGLNGILADEMGLGKTVQIIALICHLYEHNVFGPFLIVGPLSTLPNWLLEFNKFAPQVPVILYHGSEKERMPLRRDMQKKRALNKDQVLPVVLTSYEVPVRDESFLRHLQWKYIIVDEGHRLKNYKTALARTLSSFRSVNRLLLTGTPLQNNLTELWSLLHFLLPDIFDSLDAFEAWFQVEDIERGGDIANILIEQERKDKILSILHKILSPFLLRRVKSEVNLHLPPKKEVLVYCPLSPIQRKLYEAILDRSIIKMMSVQENSLIIKDNPDGTKVKRRSSLRKNNVFEPEPQKNKWDDEVIIDYGIDQYILDVKLTNVQMALRKTVNHPYLVNMPVLPGSKILRVDEGIVTESGKMVVLDGLLTRLKKRGHKVLIFSTFTSLLDLVQEMLIMRNYDHERLDGSCSLQTRKNSIYRFNTDKDVFVFLVSTRAGGLGINLTAADTAIIFDSDWNPQADLQAQDRCHRIGQVRPVIVYRFISEGTVDEKIYTRANAKRKLEKIIIHGGKFNHSLRQNKIDAVDLEELKELLNTKSSNQELRTDGSVLTEEQWEELLDRSDLIDAMEKKTEE